MSPRSRFRPAASPAFAAGLVREVSVHPLRTAAVLALGYLAVCLPYIWFSGRVAAALAPNIAMLEQIDRAKGRPSCC